MKTTLILLNILASTISCFSHLDLCPRKITPVCGSDGNTYFNDCMLNLVAQNTPRLKRAHAGKCDPCQCNNLVYQICGSDGYTYASPCQMICENPTKELKIAFPGLCKCNCKSITYDPVCGSDGMTYGNKCLFDCLVRGHNMTLVKKGFC